MATRAQGKGSRTANGTGRPPRSNNSPKANDEQTELELDLASSGRKRAVSSADGLRKPPKAGSKAGSEVAPTAKAETREKERHARQAEVGQVAAGLGGARHGRRAPKATREKLDEAAQAADARVATK